MKIFERVQTAGKYNTAGKDMRWDHVVLFFLHRDSSPVTYSWFVCRSEEIRVEKAQESVECWVGFTVGEVDCSSQSTVCMYRFASRDRGTPWTLATTVRSLSLSRSCSDGTNLKRVWGTAKLSSRAQTMPGSPGLKILVK